MFLGLLFFSAIWCFSIAALTVFTIGAGMHIILTTSVLLGFLFASLGVYILVNRSEKVKAEDGWSIKDAAEISNPESPVAGEVKLDIKSILLGLLAVGGPGSGKSVTVIGLIQYLKKFFPKWGSAYMEGKGDFDIYQMYCSTSGKPDYFFSSELPGSDTINVCDAPTETLIDMFSRVFVGSSSEYYGDAQKKAIRSCLPLLKSFGKPMSLPDLWIFLTNDQAARDTIDKAKSQGIDSDLIAAADQYLKGSDQEERLKAIDGLLNKMHPFVVGSISSRINAYKPTLNIEEAVSKGERIYFHLPLSDIALSTATMITEKLGTIASKRQLDEKNERIPWFLFFDDWGKFMYSNFGPITARCRSAKMPCSFFFQSKGQTDAVELQGVFTTEITDNIGGMISMRINGFDTAEWMAKQFGTYESEQLVTRTGDDNQTLSVIDKPRVKAQEIRDMNQGEAIVQIFETGDGGLMKNRLYNLRFPMPDNDYEEPELWPVKPIANDNDECEGLHLWRDYKNPDDLVARKRESVKAALKDEESEAEDFAVDDGDIFL